MRSERHRSLLTLVTYIKILWGLAGHWAPLINFNHWVGLVHKDIIIIIKKEKKKLCMCMCMYVGGRGESVKQKKKRAQLQRESLHQQPYIYLLIYILPSTFLHPILMHSLNPSPPILWHFLMMRPYAGFHARLAAILIMLDLFLIVANTTDNDDDHINSHSSISHLGHHRRQTLSNGLGITPPMG